MAGLGDFLSAHILAMLGLVCFGMHLSAPSVSLPDQRAWERIVPF
jgi:hypothetical protein